MKSNSHPFFYSTTCKSGIKHALTFLSLFFFIFSACSDSKNEAEDKKYQENTEIVVTEEEIKPKESAKRPEEKALVLIKNRSLQKQNQFIITNNDTLLTFCNCQKNVKENRLAIQISKHFPSASKLRVSPPNYYSNIYVGASEHDENIDSLQSSVITIHLKDSIIERVEFYRSSSEKQFNGKHTIKKEISHIEIEINKTDYKIADQVWGRYKSNLPFEFGIHPGDTIVEGTFACNNWIIHEFQ